MEESSSKSAVGSSITLQCRFRGSPEPYVTWRKNNIIVDTSKPSRFPGISELTLKSVGIKDTGEYSCEVENMLGSERKKFQIDVIGKA